MSLENQEERNKGWKNRTQACVSHEKSGVRDKHNWRTTRNKCDLSILLSSKIEKSYLF